MTHFLALSCCMQFLRDFCMLFCIRSRGLYTTAKVLGNASEGRRGYGMLKSKRTARASAQKARLDACRWNWVWHRRMGYRLAFLVAGKNLGAVLDSEAGERRSRVCQPFRSVTRELAQTDRYEPSCIERKRTQIAVHTRTWDTASWIVNSDAFRHAA